MKKQNESCVTMSKRAKQLYLRKLDREYASFGFYDAYNEYQKIKEINRQNKLDKSVTKSGWLETNDQELKSSRDVVEGYCQ